MNFYTYIIYSAKLDKFYIGHTENLETRLDQHNSGISSYIAKASDWQLVYSEPHPSRELARKREIEIKKKKSRNYIEWLIQF